MKRVISFFMRIGVSALLLLIALALFTNVRTTITPDDIMVFENSLSLRKPAGQITYSKELETIRGVQAKVFSEVFFGKGIPENMSREPVELLRIGKGECYDRSRTLDKALAYIGFETRHVYILYREGKSLWRAMITRKHPSHAVTEVKTSRGWLLVDSNSPWIAITGEGVPVDADNVWKRVDEFDNVPKQLREPWWAIRGMYSRDGKFYTPYIPFPEFNWRDFFAWLLS